MPPDPQILLCDPDVVAAVAKQPLPLAAASVSDCMWLAKVVLLTQTSLMSAMPHVAHSKNKFSQTSVKTACKRHTTHPTRLEGKNGAGHRGICSSSNSAVTANNQGPGGVTSLERVLGSSGLSFGTKVDMLHKSKEPWHCTQYTRQPIS